MVSTKIALVNFHNMEKKSSSMDESLGLQYISIYLKKKGIMADIIDLATEDISFEQLLENIQEKKYKIIGFSVYAITYHTTKNFINQLLETMKGIHIVLGGYFPSLAHNEVLGELKGSIDGILFGEGEEVFYQYANCVLQGLPYQQIDGLIYYKNDAVVVNKKMELLYDLDAIPIPERKHIKNRKLAKVYSSRGCYGKCSFCSIYCYFGHGKTRWRTRSVENIIEEIKYLKKIHKISSIYFVDDNFMGPGKRGRERAKCLAKAIIDNNIEITYSVEFRVNDFDSATVILLRKSGLRKVFYGIESGVQRELDIMCKLVTKKQNIDAIRSTNDVGIEPNIGFMMFTPYTTLEEVTENLKFLREMIPYNCLGNSMLTSKLIIQPGFSIYVMLEKEGRVKWNQKNCEYEYSFLDDKVKRCYELLTVNYNKILLKLNSELGALKDKLFLNDIYDQSKKLYVMIRTLEKDTFILELDFAEQIVKIVEMKDEERDSCLKQLNDTIAQKAEELYKEAVKKMEAVNVLLSGGSNENIYS